MRTDKFTVKSQEAVQKAHQLAEEKGNQQVDVEHLLYVLLEDVIALEIIRMLGVDIKTLRTCFLKLFHSLSLIRNY